MNTLIAKGPHAYESLLPFRSLDNETMTNVAKDAAKAEKLRSRVLCHQSLDDSPQEMVICLEPRTYIRPHRHFGRAESGLGLSGLAEAVFFDDDGEITDVWPMGTYGSGLRFFYRIEEPVFHCLLVRKSAFAFHEVSTGPFTTDSTEFAPWTPSEDDSTKVDTFLDNLATKVDEFYHMKKDG